MSKNNGTINGDMNYKNSSYKAFPQLEMSFTGNW